MAPTPSHHTPMQRSSAAESERTRLAYAVHPADHLTPVLAYERLRAHGHRVSLLESVDGPARLARTSFVALDPIASLRARGGSATLSALSEDARALGLQAEHTELELTPLEALRAAQRMVANPALGQPSGARTRGAAIPGFRGGWIGALSFEAATTLERRVPRPADDPFGFPDAAFDLFRDVVVFDHERQTMTLVCAAPGGARHHSRACERLERLAHELAVAPDPPHAPHDQGGPFRLCPGPLEESLDDGEFAARVERAQGEIAAGEVFQCVLSRSFRRRFTGDPFTLYRVLRMVNPAPHMYFHRIDDVTLVGSSPERLVRVRGRELEVAPIAGTRPRGRDDAEDDALAAELCADPKERAEHDMLVDLARNDAGRVARYGTVALREHAALTRFPRVMHLVSRVEAELANGRDALDAVAATFPAGTVSGAPKVRALQLIAELEASARGPYGGAFGYLDLAGDLDLAIVLRTIVCRGDTLHIQAGAGVVFGSDPAAEARETRHKASALLEALELASGPPFGAEASGVPDPFQLMTCAAEVRS